MTGIKRLVREIHRRSLWQVLGIFLAASWFVLQVVEVLTESAGLPDWTPSMALVLLLIGLPMCLATAFVQEGLPGQSDDETTVEDRHRPDEGSATPVNLAAGTGSLDLPSSRPRRIARLFTWRHAMMGGAGAAGLLALAVVGYFAMWSLGVGPVGNLVAQGVIEEGDRIVLAEFRDATGEGLGAVVTDALRADLTESSVLGLLDAADIEPALQRMRVEPGTPLTPELALEVAVRDGFKAVLEGSVARAGTGYVITATLVEAQSGRTVATFRGTATDDGEIIGAIDKLSQDIREKSGETLREIRAGLPLARVTTASLEALKLYAEAGRTFGTTATSRTTDLLEQAVALDSTFTSAWLRLSFHLANNALDFERSRYAAEAAYRHRGDLPQRSQYFIEAVYHSNRGEREEAIEAYQNVLALAPDDFGSLNNLARHLTAVGEWERALELHRRAIELAARSTISYLNLVSAELRMGNVEEAADVLRRWEAEYPDGANLEAHRIGIALLAGAPDRAQAYASALLDDPTLPVSVRIDGAEGMAKVSYRRGQIGAAREYFRRSIELADRAASAAGALQRIAFVGAEFMVTGGESLGPELTSWLLEGSFDVEALPVLADQDIAAFIAVSGADLDGLAPLAGQSPRMAGVLAAAAGFRAWLASPEDLLERVEQLRRSVGCVTDHCWQWQRAESAIRSEAWDVAVDLLERMSVRGDEPGLTGLIDLQAILRLGPAYEGAGRNADAVAAYQRVVDLWADADGEGRELVERYEERVRALTGGGV